MAVMVFEYALLHFVRVAAASFVKVERFVMDGRRLEIWVFALRIAVFGGTCVGTYLMR